MTDTERFPDWYTAALDRERVERAYRELDEYPELDTDDRDVDLERELRLDEERIDAEMTRAELRGIAPPSH